MGDDGRGVPVVWEDSSVQFYGMFQVGWFDFAQLLWLVKKKKTLMIVLFFNWIEKRFVLFVVLGQSSSIIRM